MFSIATIKQHAEDFVHNLGVAADHDLARAVSGFAIFLEGKQAEADAKAYLEKKGYTVVPPAMSNELPSSEHVAAP